MHDDESSGAHEQLTHFRQAGLLQREGEQIHDDLLVYHSFLERIVVLLGLGKVLDILAVEQLAG